MFQVHSTLCEQIENPVGSEEIAPTLCSVGGRNLHLIQRITSASRVGFTASNDVWFTRSYCQMSPVLSLIRAHQSRMASSLAVVPSQTAALGLNDPVDLALANALHHHPVGVIKSDSPARLQIVHAELRPGLALLGSAE